MRMMGKRINILARQLNDHLNLTEGRWLLARHDVVRFEIADRTSAYR